MKRHDDIAAATEGELIRKTPGVLGGDARIGDRRIAVWMLVLEPRDGLRDQEIRESYEPRLTQAELDSAWKYAAGHGKGVRTLFGPSRKGS